MTHWVVLVGPGVSNEVLLSTPRLYEALQAVNALTIVAPALRIALRRSEQALCRRVLLIEDGQRTVERPEDLPQPAMEPLTQRVVEAAPEPAEFTVGGGA